MGSSSSTENSKDYTTIRINPDGKIDYEMMVSDKVAYLVIDFTYKTKGCCFSSICSRRVVQKNNPDVIRKEFNMLRDKPYSYLKNRYVFKKFDILEMNSATMYVKGNIEQI